MKRLFSILTLVAIFLAGWAHLAFSAESLAKNCSETTKLLILLAPLEAIILFGLYSVATILKRLIFFPSCPAAADELQDEMKQARQDLNKKGFKFREPKQAQK